MPDPAKPTQQELSVFTAPSSGLTEAQVKELKDKYGLDVRVRSSSAVVNNLLKVADDVVAYDRTHPGYDRTYDRDPNAKHQLGAELVNPAERIQGDISKVGNVTQPGISGAAKQGQH